MASDILEKILTETSASNSTNNDPFENNDFGDGGHDDHHHHRHHHHHHHHHEPPCFLAGTMILAGTQEIKVEELRPGDLVSTVDGKLEPVLWVGRRRIAADSVDVSHVLPVRIRSNALAEGTPCRDLLVSQDHAVIVDGVLIQAGALVNGVSIVRENAMSAEFEYYHIELNRHELIFADGVPAETFVDNVDRMGFDNWSEHQALYPDADAIVEMPYPRAKAHRQVPISIREKLAARAAMLYEASMSSAA